MILVSMIEVDFQDDEERPKIRQLKHLERLDNDGCDYNKDADGHDNKRHDSTNVVG